MDYLGFFLPTMAELSSCNKHSMAHKAKNIYSLAFYKKILLISALNKSQKNFF